MLFILQHRKTRPFKTERLLMGRKESNQTYKTNGPLREKTWLRRLAHNTGADKPAHPRSLISAFVIRYRKESYVTLLPVKFQFSS